MKAGSFNKGQKVNLVLTLLCKIFAVVNLADELIDYY